MYTPMLIAQNADIVSQANTSSVPEASITTRLACLVVLLKMFMLLEAQSVLPPHKRIIAHVLQSRVHISQTFSSLESSQLIMHVITNHAQMQPLPSRCTPLTRHGSYNPSAALDTTSLELQASWVVTFDSAVQLGTT
jgi:hypothetical protein